MPIYVTNIRLMKQQYLYLLPEESLFEIKLELNLDIGKSYMKILINHCPSR